MKLARLVLPFLRHRERIGRAARTVRLEREAIHRFVAHLEGEGVRTVEQLTRDRVRGFQDDLADTETQRGARLKAQTRRGILTAVKHFLRWLDREDYLALDLARVVELPKRDRPLPRDVIDAPEMKRLLAAPDVTSRLGLRDRGILEVFYSTGIRVNELTGIRSADLDLAGGFLRVTRPKGGRQRVVPLGRIAVEVIREYLAHARPELVGEDDVPQLFVSRTGRALDNTAVEWMVRKYARLARIRKTITPHVFRVTTATSMLRAGANVRHVQELLGHRSVATLEPYLKLTITELKDAHTRYHPRERGPA